MATWQVTPVAHPDLDSIYTWWYDAVTVRLARADFSQPCI